MATDKPSELNWQTASETPEELTRVRFEMIGDCFTGRYDGFKKQRNASGEYVQFLFTGADGVRYLMNPAYTLNAAMRNVPVRSAVRVTLSGQRNIGKKSPMGLYDVEWAQLPAGTDIPGPVVSNDDMLKAPDTSSQYDESWPQEEPPF